MARKKDYVFALIWIAIIVFLGIIFLTNISYFASAESTEDLQVDSVLLKTAIKSDGSFTGKIRITNPQEKEEKISIKVLNLEGLVFPEQEIFILNPGEIKSINVVFSNPENKENGVYSGTLEISSEKQKKEIPVIVEIESKDVLFDSNINLFPKDEIPPGEKVNAQIKIFDLANIGTSNIEMSYFINDFKSNIIVHETENLVVKDDVLITKNFNIPEEIEKGDYVFAVVLNYKNSTGTASSFFRIDGSSAGGFSGFLDENLSYTVLLFVFILFVLLVFIFYSIYSKDRYFEKWRKEAITELRRKEKDLRKVRLAKREKKLRKGRLVKKEKKLKKERKPKKIIKFEKPKDKKAKREQINTIKEGLQEKLSTLERAYSASYITKDSYEKGKERIKKLLKGI